MRRSILSLFIALGILGLLLPFALAPVANAAPSTKSTDMVAFEENGSTGVGNYMLGMNDTGAISRWGASNLTNWTKPAEFEIGDLNGDGRSDIVAFEKTTSTRGNYMLGINQGNSKFAWLASNLQNWALPTSFELGDINGDGRSDILAYEPNSASNGTFRVGINQGNNTFAWLTSNLQNYQPVTQFRLADMNGDGKTDILAHQPVGLGQPTGSYYLGIATANDYFIWFSFIGAGFPSPHQLEAGDINGDGRMDFVAVEAATSGGGVNYMEAIQVGNDNHSYQWRYSNLTNWTDPYAIQLGDMYKDGRAEIVAAESKSSNQVTYYQGNNLGNYNFSWGPNLQNFAKPVGFRLGNIDDK